MVDRGVINQFASVLYITALSHRSVNKAHKNITISDPKSMVQNGGLLPKSTYEQDGS